MQPEVLDWLLEESAPSIRYRTMIELLDMRGSDPLAKATYEQIQNSKAVNQIFCRMHPEAYWEYNGHGTGVEYVDYYTAHFNLAFLAELGMTRDDARIRRAADRYLGLQKPDGDFHKHFSCLNGYNLRTLIMLGYRDDSRVQRIIDLLVHTTRSDGGYLCDLHEGKHKTRPAKSCFRGSQKVLLAYAMLPEIWESAQCQQLVVYFLNRRVYHRISQPNEVIRGECTATLFPFTWRSGLLEPLYALSKMGYGDHHALEPAWDQLETKRDDQGRYILDWTPTRSYFKVGKRGEANKWVTLYAYLALKYRSASPIAPKS